MQQTSSHSGGPKALNPSPNAPKKKTPMNPKVLIGIGVGVLILIGAIVAAVILTRPPTEPPLNADPSTILKFAGTPQFEKLPFERQVIHMKLIDEAEKSLKDAYEAGSISSEELRLAKELAWFGKQLDRMNEYYAKPQNQRQAYLDKLIDKDEKKDAEDEKKEKDKPMKTADPNERKSGDVQRNQLSEEIRPMTWPKDAQAKWTAYRTHLRERKEAMKPPEAPVTGTGTK
jgi:hypothetical protein